MAGRHVRRRWRLMTAVGVLMLLTGGAVFARIGLYLRHSTVAAATLTRHLRAAATSAVHSDGTCSAVPPSRVTGPGARLILQAQAITLTAPVLAGTGESVLSEGVGHVDASNWPDQGGTVVLEAHDVTFFHDIGSLASGAVITLTAPCRSWTYRVTAHRVVRAATPVEHTARPRLVLVTCWPTNALYITDKRLIVEAEFTSSSTLPASPDGTSSPRPSTSSPAAAPVVSPALPPGVTAAQVAPDAVRVPLGRLHVDPRFDTSWKNSAAPLRTSDAAATMFDAALVAIRDGHHDWWATLGPGVNPSTYALLVGQRPTWEGLVDIDETGSGTTVQAATVTATITVRGRVYLLEVDMTARASRLVISRWIMTPR